MTLKFNDGMEFDTSGPLRVIHRKDGCYVTGKGYLIPCGSRQEGEEIVRDMRTDGDPQREGHDVR